MLADYTDFYPYLVPELPGCSKPLILQNIRFVALDFFQQTQAWQETLTAINIVADQATYTLTSPLGDCMIDRAIYIEYNGSELDKRNWSQPTRTSLKLAWTPAYAETGALVVKVALLPTPDADELPETVFFERVDAIAAGVKARLMLQPGKSWTDQNTALLYQRQYSVAVTDAKLEQMRNNSNHAQSLTIRDFI